jgi:hypothetical protein
MAGQGPSEEKAKYNTHLTIDLGRNVLNDNAEYHAHESSQTREGVNLPEGPINSDAQHDK